MRKIILIVIVALFAGNALGQIFEEPVIINSENYGPKLILNDPITSNKVPIEFRSNDIIKWEFGLRPISNGNDLSLWRYNGSYSPIIWFKYSNGNVGIGTNTPSNKLDINGEMAVGSGSVNSNTTKIYIRNTAGKTWAISSGSNAISENIFSIYNWTDNSTSPFLQINNNGNLGIGTSLPNNKLDVNGEIALGSGSVNANTTKIFIRNSSGNTWAISSGANMISESSFSIYNWTNNQTEPFFHITSIGNIGIGTTTTGTHKLAVEGTIGAREIKVEAPPSWSDFVFNETYELKNLEEVENFIEKNNHLPDVPSEKEVMENGIQLGEMDAKLLQKIEELTLYMIDINKRVKSLEEENKELKKENSILKTQ